MMFTTMLFTEVMFIIVVFTEGMFTLMVFSEVMYTIMVFATAWVATVAIATAGFSKLRLLQLGLLQLHWLQLGLLQFATVVCVFLPQALQDEVRSQQPQMNALQRRFEQVQPYASPDGLNKLKQKQDDIKQTWNDINTGVLERQKMLTTAVQHRRDFYGRMQDFEKWVKKIQRKLDTGSEIYSDEVADELAKLQVSVVYRLCRVPSVS